MTISCDPDFGSWKGRPYPFLPSHSVKKEPLKFQGFLLFPFYSSCSHSIVPTESEKITKVYLKFFCS